MLGYVENQGTLAAASFAEPALPPVPPAVQACDGGGSYPECSNCNMALAYCSITEWPLGLSPLECGNEVLTTWGRADPLAADFDGDGDTDLLLYGSIGTLLLSNGQCPDSGGLLDDPFTRSSSAYLIYYENVGAATAPNFAPAILSAPMGPDRAAVASGDLDGDGDLDLLAAIDGIIAVHENTTR